MFIKKYKTAKNKDFYVLVLVEQNKDKEKKYFNVVIPEELAKHLNDLGVYIDEKE